MSYSLLHGVALPIPPMLRVALGCKGDAGAIRLWHSGEVPCCEHNGMIQVIPDEIWESLTKNSVLIQLKAAGLNLGRPGVSATHALVIVDAVCVRAVQAGVNMLPRQGSSLAVPRREDTSRLRQNGPCYGKAHSYAVALVNWVDENWQCQLHTGIEPLWGEAPPGYSFPPQQQVDIEMAGCA